MPLKDLDLKYFQEKPPSKKTMYSHGEGLSVRVTPKGKVTFQYKYYNKVTSKRGEVTIGVYPNLSLSDAKKIHREMMLQVQKGKDPRVEQKKEQVDNVESLTFNELYDEWYNIIHVKHNPSNSAINKRSYVLHMKDKIGHYKADELTTPVIMNFFKPLIKNKNGIAEKLLGNFKQMYDYGFMNGKVLTHPLMSVKPKLAGIEKGKNTIYFEPHQLAQFLYVLDNAKMLRRNKIINELLLHYGCRPSELYKAERHHLDFKNNIWTVPWENHKNGKYWNSPLLRPIVSGVKELWLELIELSNSSKLVCTIQKNSNKITNTYMNNCLGFLEKKINKGGILYNDLPVELPHFSPYIFRKTSRTLWGGLEDVYVHQTCEKMQGRALGESDKYDFHKYIPQMIPIYERWWEFVQNLRVKGA